MATQLKIPRRTVGARGSAMRRYLRSVKIFGFPGFSLSYLKGIQRTLTHAATWVLTSLGVLLGLNEYEASRLDRRRESVENYYSNVLEGLGSSSQVVRIGAIGRIPKLVTSALPREDRPSLFEGALYFAGLHSHPSHQPFHEDYLRVIGALLSVGKDGELASAREGEAIISMLCELGRDGWYSAEASVYGVTRSSCLSWIWESAPAGTITRRPAYDLFRGSSLRETNFRQLRMVRAEFSQAKLRNCIFEDADINQGLFMRTKIDSTSFVNANLVKANFSGAVLSDVDFAGADLRGADFTGARLQNVNFQNSRNLESAVGLGSFTNLP